jgi:hypothetical protein
MKKYPLIMVLVIISFFSNAQDEITITGTNKITRELTPQQVIDSLEAKFPDARSVVYYKIPADAAARGWSITVEDEIDPTNTIDYYTIKFKRQDFQYYGLYKPDGTLVMSKYRETIKQIPDVIKASLKTLSKQYPGYKIRRKTYYRNTSYSNSREFFEFVAYNGNESKRVIYDGDGMLVKVR